nr:hypothetical protein [Deltaproteobacteria bacterium]
MVDEVHASDAYMTTLLREVLRFHRAAGGYALLMSATLGSVARDMYVHDRRVTEYERAAAEPYPRIALHAPGAPPHVVAPAQGRSKRVSLSTLPWMDEPAAVAQRALDAARQGARVLVLRNTVRACIETSARWRPSRRERPCTASAMSRRRITPASPGPIARPSTRPSRTASERRRRPEAASSSRRRPCSSLSTWTRTCSSPTSVRSMCSSSASGDRHATCASARRAS